MTIRRGDAPRLICEAAYRLFCAKGYAGTSIEDIAKEAGVARPTVFTAVGTKPAILKTVVDQAVTGDAAPITLAERPWWKEAADEPDPRHSLALHARNMTRIQQRTAPLMKAVEAAAAHDADAAGIWARYQQQRRAGMAEYVRSLQTKSKLRCDKQTAVDTLWMLAPDAYWRLVHDAGWSPDRYERWLADVMQRALLD